jgi:2,3-bisphosphoglycerate-dependent phosphoglycerate mutase
LSVEVVFETHSSTEDNETGIATGWLPGRLSPRGRGLAIELGARRRAEHLDAVFTSDLGRAVETAAIAFAGRDLVPIPDPRLRECNYGELNGTPHDRLDRVGHLDLPYPGGESWREAMARVAGFLDELRRGRDGQRVLVIGHVATRWGLDHVANGIPLEELVGAPFAWQPGWEYRLD